jgi:beta-1,4-mannosyl-glycoprotein beta-1,4-N-acetylglucosaminyltransferase
MKVIDCFTFNNEIDILNYRLNLLKDVVDIIVLVEANQTHVGNTKPLHYATHKDTTFHMFSNKIKHVIVNLPISTEQVLSNPGIQWKNEQFQRDCIANILDSIANEDDIILLSDADEIPDPARILEIRNNPRDLTIKCFEQDLYYYNISCKINLPWRHSKVFSYKWFLEHEDYLSNLRTSSAEPIPRGGWHLSYFGDIERIKYKLQNNAHIEHNNSKTTSTEFIQECIKKNKCLVGDEFSTTYIPIHNNVYLPPYFSKYLKEYSGS